VETLEIGTRVAAPFLGNIQFVEHRNQVNDPLHFGTAQAKPGRGGGLGFPASSTRWALVMPTAAASTKVTKNSCAPA
jgi:hypothetical protein